MVKGVDVEDMHRDKILRRQKVTPKRVTLPDGQYILARYEKLTIEMSNVTIKRT